MQTITCDACRRRIAEDEPGAATGVLIDGVRHDWCGDCMRIIRRDAARIAAQARDARLAAAAEPVQHRARNLWDGKRGPFLQLPPIRS